jgi:hypothetical protein
MLGLPHVRLSLKWEVLYKYNLAYTSFLFYVNKKKNLN